MQIINRPSPTVFTSTFTATTLTTLVLAATNVRGVIVDFVEYTWILGAISSSVVLDIRNAALNEFCSPLQDDNGPTGPINVPRSGGKLVQPVQFGSGQDIIARVNIFGTARVSVSMAYRVL